MLLLLRKNSRSILFPLLLLTGATISQFSVAAEKTPQEKFSEATTFMEAGKFADAFPILEDLAKTYPTETVLWNLGLSAAELGKNPEALRAWLAFRKAAPNEWHGRAKLIQTYQALGMIPERDNEREALLKLWESGSDPALSSQQLFCRDQFLIGAQKVAAFEYFKPAGPQLVVYSFVVPDSTGKVDHRVTLGSYDTTNKVASELGELPPGKRLFHLDLYRQGHHETYGFFVGQPSYDDIRPVVMEILEGKRKPVAASAFAADPAPSSNTEPPIPHTSPGSSRDTAIEVCQPRGEQAYLSRLLCSDGTVPTFERVGSFGPRSDHALKEGETEPSLRERINGAPLKPGQPDRHILDGYDLQCGTKKYFLYMDMYHCSQAEPNVPPADFKFREQRN